MTNLNPSIAAKIAASSDHARHGTCPRCGKSVLRARAGRIAALDAFRDRVQAITDEARGGIRQQLGNALAALDTDTNPKDQT